MIILVEIRKNNTDLLIFIALITIGVITTTFFCGSPQQGREQLVATLRQLGQTDDGSTFIRYVSNNTNNTGTHNPCTRWLEDYDSEAADVIAEVEPLAAHTDFAQIVRAIGERIDQFEFDEALEQLNALQEAMR